MQDAILALIEGLGLILSPCILPVLPIVLAASLDGGRGRPLGIISGFIVSFTLFALTARQLVSWLAIDPQVLQTGALALLALFGLVMLAPRLDAAVAGRMKGIAGLGDRLAGRYGQSGGFGGGLAVGGLIGLIWTPCAGPILAVAVVQVIQAKTDWQAALVVTMFVTGAALPMLALALAGRAALARTALLSRHAGRLRQGLGAVILLAAGLIYSGAANRLLAGAVLPDAPVTLGAGLQGGLAWPVAAPEFRGLAHWLNSPPLTMAGLKGKVVLVDFWTYSCVNCVRTLPYVTAWDRRYRDKGLVVVGVHAPEFAFEKKLANVEQAVAAHGIQYPVALDNELATWSAFRNRYWPAHYLINQDGQVVYTHFGEGHYAVTEHNIRTLLGIDPAAAQAEKPEDRAGRAAAGLTPETYLGYRRAAYFAGNEARLKADAAALYSYPARLPLHRWALTGPWEAGGEAVIARAGGAGLRLHFYAARVFLVLATESGKPLRLKVSLNGAPPAAAMAGKDVADGFVTVSNETLYELVKMEKPGEGVLEIEALEPGLKAYAFTFGE